MDKNQSAFKKNYHAEGKVSILVPRTPFPPVTESSYYSQHKSFWTLSLAPQTAFPRLRYVVICNHGVYQLSFVIFHSCETVGVFFDTIL